MGMKISALAIVSKRLRSASTAISRPKPTHEAGAQHQPEQIIAERLQHPAVGEDGGIIAQPDKVGGAGLKKLW